MVRTTTITTAMTTPMKTMIAAVAAAAVSMGRWAAEVAVRMHSEHRTRTLLMVGNQFFRCLELQRN